MLLLSKNTIILLLNVRTEKLWLSENLKLKVKKKLRPRRKFKGSMRILWRWPKMKRFSLFTALSTYNPLLPMNNERTYFTLDAKLVKRCAELSLIEGVV